MPRKSSFVPVVAQGPGWACAAEEASKLSIAMAKIRLKVNLRLMARIIRWSSDEEQ
jgi:hypothetical protein